MCGDPLFLTGMGRSRRNYVYVMDVARALLLAAKGRMNGMVNLGGEEIFTIADLARHVLEVCSSSSQMYLLPGNSDDLVVETATARDRFGIECSTALRDGLMRQHQWLLEKRPPHHEFFSYL